MIVISINSYIVCKFVLMYAEVGAAEVFAVEGNALDLDATHGVLGIQTDKQRFGYRHFGAVGKNLDVFEFYVVDTAVQSVL